MSSADDLFRAHEPFLFAMAMRLCGNPADARDLVQDTLERGLRNLHRFTPGTNERAWLVTILRRLFIDQCRTRSREPRTELPPEQLEAHPAPSVPEDAPPWAAITPEQLHQAIVQLPEPFRVVYQLHALEGCSYDVVAQRLRLPKATVGTRLIRARRKLRALLCPSAAEVEEV